MLREAARRAAGIYLAAFFLAVAGAPHHHCNDAEDLLLDQRSDSGTLVRAEGTPVGPGPAVTPMRLDRDVPCLACFSGDFVAAPATYMAFVATLTPLPALSAPAAGGFHQLLAAETSSRAPPGIS